MCSSFLATIFRALSLLRSFVMLPMERTRIVQSIWFLLPTKTNGDKKQHEFCAKNISFPVPLQLPKQYMRPSCYQNARDELLRETISLSFYSRREIPLTFCRGSNGCLELALPILLALATRKHPEPSPSSRDAISHLSWRGSLAGVFSAPLARLLILSNHFVSGFS
jgi:hypothetical protein